MRNFGAIILAAGGSSRLGQPKQLLEFEGETLVRRIVRAATEAGCTPVVVVISKSGNAVADVLHGTIAEVVVNSSAEGGIGTSIKRGVAQVVRSGPTAEAVILLACDQPFVDHALIKALINEQKTTNKSIVASRYVDTLGIPALFSRSCFDELLQLSHAGGAKPLIEADPTRVAHVEFGAGAIDIDTPADLERLRAADRPPRPVSS